MFKGCGKLRTVYSNSNCDVSKVTNNSALYMFDGCFNLMGGNGTFYCNLNPNDLQYVRLDGYQGKPGVFPEKDTTPPMFIVKRIIPPTKTEYALGEQIKTDGGQITIEMIDLQILQTQGKIQGNGKTHTFPLRHEYLAKYDSTTTGSKNITLSCFRCIPDNNQFFKV